MNKPRMGADPLGSRKNQKKKDPLEWIQDSRSDEEEATPPPAPSGSPAEPVAKASEPESKRTVPRQAVILSGGGASGAFEVGVLKALIKGLSPVTKHLPLSLDIITGTSVGAFNAASMVGHENADQAIDHLEQVWLERIASQTSRGSNGVYRFRPPARELKNPIAFAANPIEALSRIGEDSAFFTREFLGRSIDFLQSSEPLEHRFLDLINLSSFVSTTPLKKLIRDTIRFDNVRQADTVLKIVATNWETGEAEIFENGHMTEKDGTLMIMASAAIPGFFPAITLNDHHYVDGGLVMNTPLLPAIRSGADVVHMIYMDPDVKNMPLECFNNTIDTFDRMLKIQFALNINKDVEKAERINHGLAAMEHPGSTSDEERKAFAETADDILNHLSSSENPYRKLCIHRYHPRDDLSGVLGLLNFERSHIEMLIERGVQEAIEHDCDACECIMVE